MATSTASVKEKLDEEVVEEYDPVVHWSPVLDRIVAARMYLLLAQKEGVDQTLANVEKKLARLRRNPDEVLRSTGRDVRWLFPWRRRFSPVEGRARGRGVAGWVAGGGAREAIRRQPISFPALGLSGHGSYAASGSVASAGF